MATADADVKKVLNYLKSNGGGNYKVIESWRSEDGSSWYRKWSDGYLEQGGHKYAGKNSVMQADVTFPSSFTSSDSYSVVSALRTSPFDGSPRCLTQSTNKTATGFVFCANTSSDGFVEWYACGF